MVELFNFLQTSIHLNVVIEIYMYLSLMFFNVSVSILFRKCLGLLHNVWVHNRLVHVTGT